ncbi:MAG: HAD family phosphatase [Chloroflexota bacterium]
MAVATVDGLIFDFDGVILDTETPDFEVWQNVYQAHGLELPLDLWITRVGSITGAGFNPQTHFEKMTESSLDEAFLKAHEANYLAMCDQLSILPGVEAILSAAKQRGIKLAIASNSVRVWVETRLKQHNLYHYFDCIRTRDDVTQVKPAPELYLSAAACLDLPVERCVAIEDSPTGMNAALAAGMRCIAVPNTITIRLQRPEVTLTLNSLADFNLDQLIAQV